MPALQCPTCMPLLPLLHPPVVVLSQHVPKAVPTLASLADASSPLPAAPRYPPVADGVLPQHIPVVQDLHNVGEQLQQAAVLVAVDLQWGGRENK